MFIEQVRERYGGVIAAEVGPYGPTWTKQLLWDPRRRCSQR
jgi:hypothetical protein